MAGTRLLDQAAATHPTTRKVWVDGGYHKHFVEHAAALGIDMEITQRAPGTRGYTPIPKRWAVEDGTPGENDPYDSSAVRVANRVIARFASAALRLL